MSFERLSSSVTGVTGGGITLNYDSEDIGRLYSYQISNIMSSAKEDVSVKQSFSKTNSPKVFFKFMKKNLKEQEITKIQKRLILLRNNLEQAEMIGQTGLSEHCMRALVLAAKQLKIHSVLSQPIKRIPVDLIYKYKDRVREDRGDKKKCVFFEELSKFPRAIPQDVVLKIRDSKRADLFEGYYVLYLDYSKEQTMKSTETKIREKDPIVFGTFKEDPEGLYFIADWIDEVCDLTFDQVVDSLLEEDKVKVDIMQVKELVDPNYIKHLENQLAANEARLKNTKMSNYRNLAAEQKQSDEAKSKERLGLVKVKSWGVKLWENLKKFAMNNPLLQISIQTVHKVKVKK